jgi:hypothetical protein
MANGREIVFSGDCDLAADKLGGYEVIDDALIPIFDALSHNPLGFPKVNLDWDSNRYILTKAFKKRACVGVAVLYRIKRKDRDRSCRSLRRVLIRNRPGASAQWRGKWDENQEKKPTDRGPP